MTFKKSYPSTTNNSSFPPCISVLWLSNYQFLLGFSENHSDENTNGDTYFQIMITYDKVLINRMNNLSQLFFIQ